MSQQSSRVRQIVGRAAALLALTYVLAIGGTWNGIVTPGFRQFSLAMLTVCVAAWLAVLWRQPHRRALPPGAWVILALWGAAYANSVLHHDSLRAWTGAWFGALYAGVWIVLLDLRGRGVPGRWIINGALVAVAPVMLLAIIQIAPWWPAWIALERVDVAFVPPRPPGTLGNPNALGCVLAGTLPFGLVRIRWGLRRVDRVFAALWCCLAAGVLLLTVSRGAWLAACAGIVVLVPALAHPGAWLHGRAGSTRLWSGLPRAHARLLAVALIAVVIGGAAIAWTSDAFDTPRRETGPRMDFYRIGWRAFREQPWTGTGPFTFGLSQSEAQSIPPEQPHAHAHNLYLNVAAEFGIPGLVALIATAGWLAWRAVRSLGRSRNSPAQRAEVAAGTAALAAFGVHGLFDMPMIVPAVMLLYLALWSAMQEMDDVRPLSRRRRAAFLLGLTGAWTLILGAAWWTQPTYETYVAAERLLVRGQYGEASQRLKQAAGQQARNPLYWAEYGYACGLGAADGEPAYLRPGIDAYVRALTLEPSHAIWWTNLAALHWQARDVTAAIEAMRAAVRYAPDDPDMWVNLGRYLEMAGARADAEEAFERALAIEPAWGVSSFWDETALRRRVRDRHGGEALPYIQAEQRLRAGNLSEGVRILEETVANDPSQPRPYFLIARLYVQAGELDAARDYLAAARALAHSDLDWAWIRTVEAELTLAEGDKEAWAEKRSEARARLWPDDTGHPIYYGQDVANLQFLSLKVKGSLLPQVVVLGPDPLLVELLGAEP